MNIVERRANLLAGLRSHKVSATWVQRALGSGIDKSIMLLHGAGTMMALRVSSQRGSCGGWLHTHRNQCGEPAAETLTACQGYDCCPQAAPLHLTPVPFLANSAPPAFFLTTSSPSGSAMLLMYARCERSMQADTRQVGDKLQRDAGTVRFIYSPQAHQIGISDCIPE